MLTAAHSPCEEKAELAHVESDVARLVQPYNISAKLSDWERHSSANVPISMAGYKAPEIVIDNDGY